MPRRTALTLVLVLIALALAWILIPGPGATGDGGDGEPSRELAAGNGDAETDGRDLGGAPDREVERDAAGLGESAAPADPEHGIPAFRGRVTDADGRALQGAQVEAFGLVGWAVSARADDPGLVAHWQVRTDADGSFQLPEAPRDGLRFLIQVRADDLAPRELINLPAVPGRTRSLGTIALDEGFTARGVVRGPAGEPVAGARVRAFREPRRADALPDPADAAPLPGAVATTGADGAFALPSLPVGAVRLHATGPGWFGAWSAPVAGATGATVENVDLALQPARALAGVVLDSSRAPVGDALVRLQDLHAAAFRVDVRTDADGAFRAVLPADALRVRMTVAAAGHWKAARTLEPHDLRERQEILLQPMPALEGVVVDAEGAPVADAEVALAVPQRTAADARRAPANARATTNREGRFRLMPDLRSAWDGRFVVHAWSEAHAPASSAPILLRGPDLARVPELRLTLEPGRRLAGIVRDPRGRALAGARVHLRALRPMAGHRLPNVDPSRARGAIVRAATSDDAGRFAFDGLPVADYRVEAHAPGHSPGESEEIPLVEDREGVEVQVHASGGIDGRVHGDLAEVGRLRVTLMRPATPILDATVDAQGRFRFEDLAPGIYELELRPAATGDLDTAVFLGGTEPLAETAGVEVLAGTRTPVRLTLDLSERGSAQGRVQVDGRRAPDHRVVLLPLMHPVDRDPRLAGPQIMRQLRHAASDVEGRWRIGGVPAGDYWAVLCAPGRWPEGIWGGGWNDDDGPTGMARERVTVRAGSAAVADFAVELGALRVEVANAAQDVEPLVGRLDPVAEGVRDHPVRLGAAGAFFDGLPAGRWVLRLYRAGAIHVESPVTVAPGRSATVQVTLPLRR